MDRQRKRLQEYQKQKTEENNTRSKTPEQVNGVSKEGSKSFTGVKVKKDKNDVSYQSNVSFS
jgi:hypothetical protein